MDYLAPHTTYAMIELLVNRMFMLSNVNLLLLIIMKCTGCVNFNGDFVSANPLLHVVASPAERPTALAFFVCIQPSCRGVHPDVRRLHVSVSQRLGLRSHVACDVETWYLVSSPRSLVCVHRYRTSHLSRHPSNIAVSNIRLDCYGRAHVLRTLPFSSSRVQLPDALREALRNESGRVCTPSLVFRTDNPLLSNTRLLLLVTGVGLRRGRNPGLVSLEADGGVFLDVSGLHQRTGGQVLRLKTHLGEIDGIVLELVLRLRWGADRRGRLNDVVHPGVPFRRNCGVEILLSLCRRLIPARLE